jgi:hypothetical protein
MSPMTLNRKGKNSQPPLTHNKKEKKIKSHIPKEKNHEPLRVQAASPHWLSRTNPPPPAPQRKLSSPILLIRSMKFQFPKWFVAIFYLD